MTAKFCSLSVFKVSKWSPASVIINLNSWYSVTSEGDPYAVLKQSSVAHPIAISCCNIEAFLAFVACPKGRSSALETGNVLWCNSRCTRIGSTSSCGHTPQVLSCWTVPPTFPCWHLPSWTTAACPMCKLVEEANFVIFGCEVGGGVRAKEDPTVRYLPLIYVSQTQ